MGFGGLVGWVFFFFFVVCGLNEWREVWDVVCGCLREAVDERALYDGEAVVLRLLVGILGLRWWFGGCGEEIL